MAGPLQVFLLFSNIPALNAFSLSGLPIMSEATKTKSNNWGQNVRNSCREKKWTEMVGDPNVSGMSLSLG